MLKLVIISILFTVQAIAIDPTPGSGTYDPSVACISCSSSSNEDFITDYVNHTSIKKFGDYITDRCNEYKNEEFDFYGCKDGSISFVQPDSEGMFDQEGMCGQVVMANMYHMYCHWNVTVSSVDTNYASDLSPGTRPSTMVNGLNRMFSPNSDCPSSGKFVTYDDAKNDKEYISNIAALVHQYVGPNQLERTDSRGRVVKRAPVAVLFAQPGDKKVLHWVTVVDVEFGQGEQCDLIVNSFSKQYTVPCDVMAQWSRDVQKKFPLLSPYTTVQFEK